MNAGPILRWALAIAFIWLLGLALYALSILARRRVRVSSQGLFGQTFSEEDFETRLQRGLRHRGYLVEGSQGADLVIRRGGEVTLVSYRNWDRPYRVKQRITQLRRAMQVQGAAGGKLVCGFALPGRIDRALHAGAIDCIGPSELKDLLLDETAQGMTREIDLVTSFRLDPLDGPVTVPGAPIGPERVSEPHPPGAVPLLHAQHQPRCPRCNSAMQLEVAEGGSADGQHFWRCERAPQCKGIRTASNSVRAS